MFSILYRLYPLLTFLLLARARPQDVLTGGFFTIGGVDDWVSAGNYRIYECGSQAQDVESILDSTYLALQTAILSTESSAYKAFFRSTDPNSMTAVLKAIAAGTNVTTANHGSRQPTLVCTNANDHRISVFWNICNEHDRTVVIQAPGTSIIFLCPNFFSRELLPVAADCGVVNHAGTRLIPTTYMAGTRFGFLVQALADLYLQDMGMENAVGGDVRDENSCLALPPSQALMNPSSYAFYASNIRAGCTEFPTRVAVQNDRELLASQATGGGNETDVVTLDCGGAGGNSSSCSR